jgi:hypothetical protein
MWEQILVNYSLKLAKAILGRDATPEEVGVLFGDQ